MIKRITVQRLNPLSKNHSIWCMGCGKKFNEFLELYKEEPFINKIEVLIDNNDRIQGNEKRVGENHLLIDGVNMFREIKRHVVLIITSDYYEEIYQSIEPLIQGKKVRCYAYPKQYKKMTKMFIRCVNLLPLKRQMLFCAGSEPHDNADEIVRYLSNDYQGEKYRIIYLGDKENYHDKNVIFLDKWTLRKKSTFKELLKFILYYGRTKYLLYENEPVEKMHRNQKLIFLNHGTIPLKNVSDVMKQPKDLNYATCPGKGCMELYKNQYRVDYEKQIYMMPARTNYMLRCKGRIHEYVGAQTEQVILWLPTFRQLSGSDRKDAVFNTPIEVLSRNIQKISMELKKNNEILVIKKHPREKVNICMPHNCDNIYILEENDLENNRISLQELLNDSDALITDYSGIAFEYMLLDKPIGYVISDIEDYYRGFSVKQPYDYMPGTKIKDVDDLVEFLYNLKEKKDIHSRERKELVKKLFGENAYQNGAQALVDFLDGE